MFRPRIIPVLLLKHQALVKTVRFTDPKYIGDPINAVKIFNDLRTDELVFLDIEASRRNRLIDLDFVRKVGEEANMPFSVGGGIRSLDDIRKVLAAGTEKVVINTQAGCDPSFVSRAADAFGSSTVVVCIDVKRKLFGANRAWIRGGREATELDPVGFAKLMEISGAGELIVQSMERDGTMIGYDTDLIRVIADTVGIPVIALGGAGSRDDLVAGFREGHANALAAGSLFVYQNKRRGVLINYPEKGELSFDGPWN